MNAHKHLATMSASSRFLKLLLLSLLILQEAIYRGSCAKAFSRETKCMVEETTFSYECTVEDSFGTGSTNWLGDSFKCAESLNQIRLTHSLFNLKENAVCGNFSAMSVSVNGSQYTSRLSFYGDLKLNGTIINCTLSSVVLVETIIVKVGVLPPPPGPLTILLTPDFSLNVSWSSPSAPVKGEVGGYMFSVTGEECGCVSMNVSADTTSVTCSGWTAAGQNCSFGVQTLSQDCEFCSNSVTSAVTLSVPSAPQNLIVEPTYNINGEIEEIKVTFNTVDAPFLGTKINSNVSYLVSFTGPTTHHFYTGINCNSNNHCILVVNSSYLSYNNQLPYLISVMAFNVIGSGSSTIFPDQIFTNILKAGIARVDIDAATSTVHCSLLSSYTESTEVICSITYGYPPGSCERYTDSSIVTTSGPVNLTIVFSQDVNIGAEVCYTVSLKNGVTNINIVGSFSPECDPSVLGLSPSQRPSGSVRVNNGEIVYDGVMPGSMARLVCDKGYTASEQTSDRICLCNGTWSGRVQICKETLLTNKSVTDVTISTTLTFLLTLILGVSIGVFSVLVWRKFCDKPNKAVSQTYEDTITPNLPTEGNPSYNLSRHTERPVDSQIQVSQLQFDSSSKQRPSGHSPIYEDPDNYF